MATARVNEPPDLEQFHIEESRDRIVHIVFDAPGRSMNVFSNAAIHELGRIADWLKDSDVAGAVVRSGKTTAFCVGADLTELALAYDMIIAARPEDRFNLAFDHFFPLSRAIRALETSGKPVAAAIGGLALGGGCELALGCHHRVLAAGPSAALGLPESLVGLLPGAGGTQRLPRLIGIDAALPILLEGQRLSDAAALKAGIVDEVVPPGEEIAAAEAWILRTRQTRQRWDDPASTPADPRDVMMKIAPARERVLQETLGHYPAPLAILDCVEQGFSQAFDAAIRTEMSIFSHLIQRPEPRNMIEVLFLGKLDYERARRKDALSSHLADAIATLKSAIRAAADESALAAAGFGGRGTSRPQPVQSRVSPDYWFNASSSREAMIARTRIAEIVRSAEPFATQLSEQERRMVDYALVSEAGFPAYLGGPFALVRNLQRPS